MSTTEQVLAFIVDFRAEHQISPTVREVASGVGISSTSVVNYHVGKLLTEGRLMKAVGQSAFRNLVPVAVTEQAQDGEDDGFVD